MALRPKRCAARDSMGAGVDDGHLKLLVLLLLSVAAARAAGVWAICAAGPREVGVRGGVRSLAKAGRGGLCATKFKCTCLLPGIVCMPLSNRQPKKPVKNAAFEWHFSHSAAATCCSGLHLAQSCTHSHPETPA